MTDFEISEWNRSGDIEGLAWDALITAARSPVFYRKAWLQAFEAATVEAVVARRYFAAHRAGSIVAALPATCIEFSPFWHGYELDADHGPVFSGSWVTAPSIYSFSGGVAADGTSDAPTVDAILCAARRFADEHRSQAVGLLNLPEGSSLLERLRDQADAVVFLDTNHVLDLPHPFEAYVQMLPKHVRDDFKRRRRRAGDRGVSCRILDMEEVRACLPRFHQLTVEATGKHGIAPLYDLPTLQALAAAPGARVMTCSQNGDLLGGFLFFEDEDAVYVWCAALDYGRIGECSTYVCLLFDVVSYACSSGKRRIEFGRGNYAFKLKHGFRGVRLYSLFFFTRFADALLGARLATLHERLTRFVATQGGVAPDANP